MISTGIAQRGCGLSLFGIISPLPAFEAGGQVLILVGWFQ